MSDRFFVQVCPRTQVPTVYVNDEALLKRPDVFEITSEEVASFRAMNVERRAYGDAEKRITPRSVKEKQILQSALPEDDGKSSNPITEHPSVESAPQKTDDKNEVVSQESICLKDTEAINIMNTATAIEEYMLRKYRVDIPHTTRAEVRREAIKVLRRLRDEGKLF